MSLSSPVKFPLLKLPYLCIESVIRSSDIFDIIFFALLSRKTRRIVKSLRILLNGIRVSLTRYKWIALVSGLKTWKFTWYFLNRRCTEGTPLVLKRNAAPLYTSKAPFSLESYTAGNEAHALKMTLEFLNDVFKCTVDEVVIEKDNFSESGDIGVRSTVNLTLNYQKTQESGFVRDQRLNLLLQKLEVTGKCDFCVHNSGYCNPKLFKCQELLFWRDSSEWVTREILLQFQVPRLTFCELPLEVIVSFVTYWFNSENKKLEYLHIESQRRRISLETFRTAELNPVPFSDRNRVPISESFGEIDFSKGMEIIRHDGLQATIHYSEEEFLFYVWH